LAESQVLDRRTRRVLHDDVLPQLHAALLQLNSPDGSGAAAELLTDAHRQLAGLLRELPAGREPAVAGLGLIDALRRLASGEFARAFDAIDWVVDPGAEDAAQRLPPLTAEVLFYAAREAMRNAARHGRGGSQGAPLNLRIGADWEPAGLRLTVEDNGVGVDGPSTASYSESGGQGLALHSTLLAVVGGTLSVESETGRFTRVLMCLPAEALNWG
jgi:signal transduction histidine kinase